MTTKLEGIVAGPLKKTFLRLPLADQANIQKCVDAIFHDIQKFL